MLNNIELKIIKFLQQNPAQEISVLIKKFNLKRTTLLYHLKELESVGIVDKSKSGKKNLYLVADKSRLKEFFEKQQRDMEELKTSVLSQYKLTQKRSRKKMSLVFVNYFDLMPDSRKEIEKYYEIYDYSNKELYISPDEFIFRAKDAEVIVNNMACKINDKLLQKIPKAKYIHTTTHMYRYIDVNSLQKRKIHFSNISDPKYRSYSLTEFALAQTFILLRGVYEGSEQLKSGVKEFRYFQGEQLKGKVAGILGTDNISKDFQQILKNLGVEVRIYSDRASDNPHEFGVARFYSIDEIMNEADLVYILGSDDLMNSLTINLDSKLLSKIKKPIHLISISKHNRIDVEGLRKLIYKGLIKGLALDYFTNMNDINSMSEISKISHLPNVYITPDIGWYTDVSVSKLNEITVRNLVEYAKGNHDYLLF